MSIKEEIQNSKYLSNTDSLENQINPQKISSNQISKIAKK
jgi:hypothetical protein